MSRTSCRLQLEKICCKLHFANRKSYQTFRLATSVIILDDLSCRYSEARCNIWETVRSLFAALPSHLLLRGSSRYGV